MLGALMASPLDHGTEHFPPSNLQISTIDIGNRATNIIPAAARATFNVRFNDRWTSARIERWLRDILDQAGARYELQIKVSGESFLVPPGELSAILSDAIEEVVGQKPALSTTGGTSDARFIHRACPCAEFGLLNQTAHKVDEHVAVSEIEQLAAIYHNVLERYFAR
jgi:succinyl-diaminopimelate desuccinylase